MPKFWLEMRRFVKGKIRLHFKPFVKGHFLGDVSGLTVSTFGLDKLLDPPMLFGGLGLAPLPLPLGLSQMSLEFGPNALRIVTSPP